MKLSPYQRLFAWFGSLATLGAVGFVVIWLYGLPWIGIEGVYSLERQRAVATLEILAEREHDNIEAWFENQRRELRLIARGQDLARAVERNDRVRMSRALAHLQDIGSGEFEELFLVDATGEKILASISPKPPKLPEVERQQLARSFLPGVQENVQLGENRSLPSIVMTQQVILQKPDGQVAGPLGAVLVARYHLLAPLKAENLRLIENTLGAAGALALFDATGRQIASSNPGFELMSAPDIARVVQAGTEDTHVLPGPLQGGTIAVFKLLHIGVSNGVTLAILSDTREVLAGTRQVFWRVAGLGCAIFLLAIWLVFFAGGQIARGEAEVRLLNATLEQRVLDRTEALAKANQQLSAAMTTLEVTRDDLVRSEKLAGLGSLVAGVAHELNTPLGNAVLVADSLQHAHDEIVREKEAGLTRKQFEAFLDEQASGLRLLATNLGRSAELVSRFKQLAMDQASEQRRRFEVRTIIEEVAMVMTPSLKRSPVTLQTDIEADLWMDSYPGPLEQVIVNFINNALLHAYAPGQSGTLRLQARRYQDDVWIDFSDDGRGMDATTRRRAFDPFFTTRLGQGGNGLGLHIVYTIVTRLLGGRIELRSEPGAGTRFSLYLPQVAPEGGVHLQ